jgi:DnaD/phage-associated family protein
LEKDNKNSQEAANLLKHYENITGILGGLNIGLLKLAVEMHGYKNVKMAINKALEVNKANMTYINGILKNWKREGYPEDDKEVKKNGVRSYGKNSPADKNEFAGFKPKEPRKLTEAERKRIQANLI